uniref:Uncharacterized protein n=1 Tax=Brassica oleracea var. oleracea TaxID=109376 RepID=A0A0D2ZW87_BRAOL
MLMSISGISSAAHAKVLRFFLDMLRALSSKAREDWLRSRRIVSEMLRRDRL